VAGTAPSDPEAAELAVLLEEIRERVRARFPAEAAAIQPGLLAVLHARDAAEGKVASIGSVNPRPRGVIHVLIQSAKRLVARALDWHVRGQVEFNRSVVAGFTATLEALKDLTAALNGLRGEFREETKALRNSFDEGRAELNDGLQEIRDMRSHWSHWRVEWEEKLAATEQQLLRGIAGLQSAFEQNTAGFETVRAELDRTIHTELRLIRQRAALAQPAPIENGNAPAPEPASRFDYARFAERFRGTEEYVRERQRFYVPFFAGRRAVLDLGCGRGEFLELMKAADIPARGIDASGEMATLCRSKGLAVEAADVFDYLSAAPDGSLDAIFCAQLIEHFSPERLPALLRLCCAKLATDGLLAIETPNPECLAIFASHFYLDPTHQRPIPPQLLSFYLEEFGMGRIEVFRLAPAADSLPGLASLPPDFREAFFGGLDYALIARKL